MGEQICKKKVESMCGQIILIYTLKNLTVFFFKFEYLYLPWSHEIIVTSLNWSGWLVDYEFFQMGGNEKIIKCITFLFLNIIVHKQI